MRKMAANDRARQNVAKISALSQAHRQSGRSDEAALKSFLGPGDKSTNQISYIHTMCGLWVWVWMIDVTTDYRQEPINGGNRTHTDKAVMIAKCCQPSIWFSVPFLGVNKSCVLK